LKKALLTALFTVLTMTQMLSQDFKIGYEIGIGSFAMNGLKAINNDIMSGLPFDSRVVSNFPPYLFYEPGFYLKLHKIGLGVLYTFQSTGSRVSSKDYSGEFRFDMQTGSNSFGLYTDYDIWSDKKYTLSVNSTFRIMFSKLKIVEYFKLQDTVLADESVIFNSMNYSLEPGLDFSRSFGRLTVAINAGYLFCMWAEPFRSIKYHDFILKTPESGKPVKPDWNGFRLGFSIFITMSD
jgi:hypothetical protein